MSKVPHSKPAATTTSTKKMQHAASWSAGRRYPREEGPEVDSPHAIPHKVQSVRIDGGGERSESPKKVPAVPCVAHPVYTHHLNCGCMRSPKRKFDGSESPLLDDEAEQNEVHEDFEEEPPFVNPWEFQLPQKIGPVDINGARALAHAKASGAKTILTADKMGTINERYPISGEALSDENVFGKKMAVTVMRNIGTEIWCGFHDGYIRMFGHDDNKLHSEVMKHAGAVTGIAELDKCVFSASLDWKILEWQAMASAGTVKYTANQFAAHNMGIRCLAKGKVGETPLLLSAGDDGEIRAWTVGMGLPPNQGPQFVLKGHPKAVLTMHFSRDLLWSGGDDGSVCVWNLRLRARKAAFNDHTAAVCSINRFGRFVWTMAKTGKTVIYDPEDKLKIVHAMTFGEGVKGKAAACLLQVLPVAGHVIWVSDVAGKTTAWYCPCPVDRSAVPVNDRTSSVTDFEHFEKEAERYQQLEDFMHQLVKQLDTATEEHLADVAAYFQQVIEPYALAMSSNSDQKMRELLAELEAAKDMITTLRKEGNNDDLVDMLDTAKAAEEAALKKLYTSDQQNDQYTKELDELRRFNEELSNKLKEMQQREHSSRDEKINALRSEIEKLEALLTAEQQRVADMEKAYASKGPQVVQVDNTVELERLKKQISKLDNQNKELDDLVEKLMRERDDAVAKLTLAEVTVMKAGSNQKTKEQQELFNLQKQLSKLQEELANRDKEQHSQDKRLREYESEVAQLKDSLEEERRKQVGVEQTLAELRKRMRELEGEKVLWQNKKNLSPSAQKLMALEDENRQLKNALSVHKHHITRLSSNEVGLEKLLNEVKTSKSLGNLSPSRQRKEASPSPCAHSGDKHDPKTCVWCSGIINVSMGGTFGLASPEWRFQKMREERARSSERRPSTQRSVSANHEKSTQKSPSRSTRDSRSKSPLRIPRGPMIQPDGLTDGAVNAANMAKTAKKNQAAARIDQLTMAKDTAKDQQVRQALVKEILTLHQQIGKT